jgi:proteic killer suppression protein
MEIFFRDKKLAALVADEKKLKREFGRYARNVQLRLDLLRQARTLADVPHHPPPRRHWMKGSEKTFAIDVKAKSDKWRIEFDVANDPVPRKEDGGIDLSAVTAIEIVVISVHYDD